MDTHGDRVDRVDSGRQRSTAVDSREVDSGSTAVDSVVDRVDRVDRVDSQGSVFKACLSLPKHTPQMRGGGSSAPGRMRIEQGGARPGQPR